MKKLMVALLCAMAGGCAGSASFRMHGQTGENALVGAWRGKVQFATGALASVKDLEFLYVFNLGGTMTESSNYDLSPPVPPAYGAWRKTGPRQFEAKYVFYQTKPPASFDDITRGNGWSPAGYGELLEAISLAPDGNSYRSTIRLQMYDAAGKPTGDHDTARVDARRLNF